MGWFNHQLFDLHPQLQRHDEQTSAPHPPHLCGGTGLSIHQLQLEDRNLEIWVGVADLNSLTHRIHVWYIYLHLVDFMENVGKIPYMDPMGH